jgi:uncharacterized protein YndB with AHSA1/START domain
MTTHSTSTADRFDTAVIQADDRVPAIHVWRDFAATPEQLHRAHTDPELFARWIGPVGLTNEILEWDAKDGGHWRYRSTADGFEGHFRGCFHTVRRDKIVQTFTWEGMPDEVSLETLTFTDLGDGRTRLHAVSLCDSFEGRDQWLASGMEHGIQDGYAKIDAMAERGEL